MSPDVEEQVERPSRRTQQRSDLAALEVMKDTQLPVDIIVMVQQPIGPLLLREKISLRVSQAGFPLQNAFAQP